MPTKQAKPTNDNDQGSNNVHELEAPTKKQQLKGMNYDQQMAALAPKGGPFKAKVSPAAKLNEPDGKRVAGQKCFSSVNNRMTMQHPTLGKVSIKSGQETLDVERLRDSDVSGSPPIEYNLVAPGVIELADGHHRFAAAAVYGYEAPFKAAPSKQSGATSDEWSAMTWMDAQGTKGDEDKMEAFRRRQAKRMANRNRKPKKKKKRGTKKKN